MYSEEKLNAAKTAMLFQSKFLLSSADASLDGSRSKSLLILLGNNFFFLFFYGFIANFKKF